MHRKVVVVAAAAAAAATATAEGWIAERETVIP